MRFGPVALDEAEGAILAHGLTLGGRRLAKGTRLGAGEIAAARAAGLATVTVARLDPGDVPEDAAAVRLARALAGPGVEPLPPVHGRVDLVAGADGLLLLDPAAIDALNRVDEAVTLATLLPHAPVPRGQVVATVKIIPYAVPEATVGAAERAASPLAVAGFRPLAYALFQTELPGTAAKMLDKTARVTAGRVEAIGGRLTGDVRCSHVTDALAALLRESTADVLLVAGASATVDRADVIPAAIVAAGGVVDRVGMPCDPGNLLCLGRIGRRIIVGLPGCARSPKRNGLDLVLERIAAGLPVDIAGLGVGGLLADTTDRGEPRVERTAKAGALVQPIVLAAGRGSRMGPAGKLDRPVAGVPMISRVLDTVAAAGLPTPIVVVGAHAPAVLAAIGERPARIVEATDHARGLARSLAAGIAAVPEEAGAALVLLGDMPHVAPETLRALAATASPDLDAAMPVHDGRRGNPVLWGRRWFARLAALQGDIGGKALLAELGDRVTELMVADRGVLIDLDTPDALVG